MALTHAQRGWWFEDAVAGTVLRHPGGRTIGEAEHVQLAWLTHNVSDVHGNRDAAARGPWGEPLVLGALTAAIVIGLAAAATGPPSTVAAATGRGWRSIRLAGTVTAGDTLTAESHVEAVWPADDAGGYVRRTVLGRNQHGRVVVTIEDEAFAPSRPALPSSNVSGGISNV